MAKAKSKKSSTSRSRSRARKPPTRRSAGIAGSEIPAIWRERFKLLPKFDPIKTAKTAIFSAKHAEHAINFIEKALRHIEGDTAGKPFLLGEWQKAFIGCLFGWRRPDGSRRFREVLLYVPRKNGKTPLVAAILIYCFMCEEEAGSQIYCGASDKETAGHVYRHASGFVDNCIELKRRLRPYKSTKRITKRDDAAAFIAVLTKGGKTKHGGNTHVAAVDELHVTERELVEVLQTSMASAVRKNPLMLYMTTADFKRVSICNEKYDYAKKVCSGAIEDEAFLPVIFEAGPKDDWRSEATWEKANPNLDVSVSREYLRRECGKAMVTPSYEGVFRRLHLNQQTEQESIYIPLTTWDLIDTGVDPAEWRKRKLEEHAGDSCVGGLDLGSVADLTGMVLLFDDNEGGIDALPFFWVPGDTADERQMQDEAPYATWIEQGFIFGTEGERTDYDQVREDINELANRFGITELGVDRLFQGEQLMHQLEEDGLNVFAFSMSPMNLVAPSKKFIEVVSAGRFHHGNNPVMRWMLSNTGAREWMEYIIPVKARKGVRIDGVICSLMGISRWMGGDLDDDYYEENDLFIVGGDDETEEGVPL